VGVGYVLGPLDVAAVPVWKSLCDVLLSLRFVLGCFTVSCATGRRFVSVGNLKRWANGRLHDKVGLLAHWQ
jgi:hypothetical protein